MSKPNPESVNKKKQLRSWQKSMKWKKNKLKRIIEIELNL